MRKTSKYLLVRALARLTLSCALLWLACGELPPGGDGALRPRRGSDTQALQATSVWGPTGALATARYSHTATLLPSGKVLAAGGFGSGGSLASAEVYDPDTGVWSPTGALATARYGHTATLLPSGKVLVTGGVGPAGPNSSAEVYDPATGTWSPTSALATARYNHTATLLPTGKVLVTRGFGSGGSLDSAEVYDPATGVWSPTGALATDRSGHTATLLSSGKVLVTGSEFPLTSAKTEVYDPARDTSSPTGDLATGRSRHTATLLPDGTVLITGGFGTDASFLASAEVYDPDRGLWSPTGALATARMNHTATLLPDGTVLITGGEGPTGFSSLASAEVYDPDTGAWSPASALATARSYHTATLLPDGTVLVTGGHGPSGPLASAEVYQANLVVRTPANGSTLNNPWPAYTGMAEPVSTVTVIVDGTTVGSTTAHDSGEWAFMQPVALVEGPHRVMATATDAWSNTSTESRPHTFTVDTTPPTAPVVLTPSQGSTLNTPRPTYTGTAEAGSTVGVMVDGRAVGTATPSASGAWAFIQPVALGEGPHTVTATATDAGSNTSAESHAHTFAVDTVPPVEPSLQEPAAGQRLLTARPVFSGTAEPDTTVTLFVDGAEAGSAQADAAGLWSVVPVAALSSGEHHASALATDRVGNRGLRLPEVPFSISQRGNYRLGCAADPSPWLAPWPWALLLLGLLRQPRSSVTPRR